LAFAKKDGNTLVIVTGDHETGGLTIPKYDRKGMHSRFTTYDHTAVMVPVFAFGPGAENFSGIYENTEIQKKIVKLLGL
jgi:alkaline phosphatase